jgi:phosphopentomutase
MKEALKGKDTAMGHWQIEEILLKQPLLTYPGEIRRTCWIYAA